LTNGGSGVIVEWIGRVLSGYHFVNEQDFFINEKDSTVSVCWRAADAVKNWT
jgi:hypothetical protein